MPPLFLAGCFKFLQRFDVFCLPAFGSLYDVELDLLPFLQAAEAAGLDSREVDENIFAILAADKAIALRVVEPLYCSCFHCVANSFSLVILLRDQTQDNAGRCCLALLLTNRFRSNAGTFYLTDTIFLQVFVCTRDRRTPGTSLQVDEQARLSLVHRGNARLADEPTGLRPDARGKARAYTIWGGAEPHHHTGSPHSSTLAANLFWFGGQLAEDVLQNAAVLVVERFLGRVNAHLGLEADVLPVRPAGTHLHYTLRREFLDDRS
jgi:hypothetical protein